MLYRVIQVWREDGRRIFVAWFERCMVALAGLHSAIRCCSDRVESELEEYYFEFAPCVIATVATSLRAS